MSFSVKIVLGGHVKEDGMSMVYLQAVIDRQRATVPLGFYLKPIDFDKKKQRVKPTHANAKDYDVEFLNAIAKANTIASKFRGNGLLLTPESFKKNFTDPTESMDLIRFMRHELELKRPTLSVNTHKSHNTVINKLAEFKKKILFNEVSRELVQNFRNKLIKDGNGGSTIEKVIKILKQYLEEARKKGISVREVDIKIKSFLVNKSALTEAEVKKMEDYYFETDCPKNHYTVLQYFLFSCYTGLRISDITVLTWQNMSNDLLVITPVKTKNNNQTVTVPLLPVSKRFLPTYTADKGLVFTCFSDQANNRILKKIAAHLTIKKNVTYHTSRHTFASFLAEGGDVVALQKLLGHGDIKTSMGYVHTSTKQLVDAMVNRFGLE